MFHARYVARELRRRRARTLLTALGLASGVGLVVAMLGVSQGLSDAQGQVLQPLNSVGTDILVTRVVGSTSQTSTSTTTSTTVPAQGGFARGGGGGGFFGGRGDSGVDRADAQALEDENKNVVTDLAALGKPGDKFTRDFFLSATLLSFPDQAVAKIAGLDGVDSAVGGMMQLAEHQTGTVPQIVATLQTGGDTLTQTVRPDPMTDAERQQVRTCIESRQGTSAGGAAPGGEAPGGAAPGGGGGGGGFRGNPAFEDCLPQRFREFQARFTTPLRTIQQVVNPPTTDIVNESYTAAGVDPRSPGTGLVTSEQLEKGRWLKTGAADEVLLNVAYAAKKQLAVGATLPINGQTFTVVGLVQPTLTGNTADVYFPLTTLQSLAGKQGRVTQVLVRADRASDVPRLTAAIQKQLPGAEVVTAASVAAQVSGSLTDARDLVDRFGGVLAAIVLLAAFVIAVLLTLSSIAKRVREIGTLRAIGWSKGRVLRQLLAETLGIGVLGAVLGLVAGAVIAAVVGAVSPELSATGAQVPGVASSSAAQLFGQVQQTVTTKVALHVPLHPSTLLWGVVFALVGALLAGLVGGWRAARLSPAVALRDIG